MVAREVHRAEQQVPELVLQRVGPAGGSRFHHLSELFLDLCDDRRDLRPVETDAGGTPLELVGANEGRQREGHAVERRYLFRFREAAARVAPPLGAIRDRALRPPFRRHVGRRVIPGVPRDPARGFRRTLFGLRPLPRRVTFLVRGERRLTEHVRMAPYHLLGDGTRDVVEVERPLLLGHARVEDHLQEQVAELVAEVLAIFAFDRVDHLVGLLDRVRGDAREGLRDVPGAAARGISEPPHDPDQLVERR